MRERDPLFTTGTVFTADGDPHDWEKYGINHRWLRAGVVRDECYLAEPSAEWRGFDVAYVGSYPYPHAEWPHRNRLVEHLGQRFGDRFLRVGGRHAVRGHRLNELYATVPVIVGDTVAFREADSLFWSDRAYETGGRGGYLVHPFIAALFEEVSFHPYRFGHFDEVDEIIDYVLAGHRATAPTQEYVKNHCTYTQRAGELLAALDLEHQEVPT